jgi:hypothetical protein
MEENLSCPIALLRFQKRVIFELTLWIVCNHKRRLALCGAASGSQIDLELLADSPWCPSPQDNIVAAATKILEIQHIDRTGHNSRQRLSDSHSTFLCFRNGGKGEELHQICDAAVDSVRKDGPHITHVSIVIDIVSLLLRQI